MYEKDWRYLSKYSYSEFKNIFCISIHFFLEWVRITFGIERNSSVRNASEHDFSCFAFNNIL